MDEKDAAILRALMADGRKSFREVARETGMTTPTVSARVERMVDGKIIKGFVPVLNISTIAKDDLAKLGKPASNVKAKIAGVKRPLRRISVEVYRSPRSEGEVVDEKTLSDHISHYPTGTVFREDYTYERGDVFRLRIKTAEDRLDMFMAVPFWVEKIEIMKVLKRLMRFAPGNRVRLVTSFIDQKQTEEEMTETFLMLMRLKREQMLELMKSGDPAENRRLLLLIYGGKKR